MSLSSAPGPGRVGGGWPALKLLLFCVRLGGWPALKLLLFCVRLGGRRHPGHFVAPVAVVRRDLLYVSYPCEHAAPAAGGAVDEDVDAYRGVFRGFMHSRTQACVVGGGGGAPLEPCVRWRAAPAAATACGV
jgi:hypothetical protein